MRMTSLPHTMCLLLLASVAAVNAGSSQHTPGNQQQSGPPMIESSGTASDDPAARAMESRQARLRNDDRQKHLVADTDKLLALATQLHEDVGKTDKNVLSLDVIKRADEIERLAHAVKERMRN